MNSNNISKTLEQTDGAADSQPRKQNTVSNAFTVGGHYELTMQQSRAFPCAVRHGGTPPNWMSELRFRRRLLVIKPL
jgi:hypothetical protein